MKSPWYLIQFLKYCKMVKDLFYFSDETRNQIWHPVDLLIHENAFIGEVHFDFCLE